jgi:hypothetical protein
MDGRATRHREYTQAPIAEQKHTRFVDGLKLATFYSCQRTSGSGLRVSQDAIPSDFRALWTIKP